MARYVTTVRTSWSPEQAFAYMADLRNFAAWDPGVKGVIQVDGDGAGADASFDVTVAVPGRDMVLRYRTVQFDAPTEVLVIASTGLLTSEDRVSVVAEAGRRLLGDLRRGPAPVRPPAAGGPRSAAGVRQDRRPGRSRAADRARRRRARRADAA